MFVWKYVPTYYRRGTIVGYGDPITQSMPRTEGGGTGNVSGANGGTATYSSHASPASRSAASKPQTSENRGGYYEGGMGSSHKGGVYHNDSTGNHYQPRTGGTN